MWNLQTCNKLISDRSQQRVSPFLIRSPINCIEGNWNRCSRGWESSSLINLISSIRRISSICQGKIGGFRLIGWIKFCWRKWKQSGKRNITRINWDLRLSIWRLWMLIRWRSWTIRLLRRIKYFSFYFREFAISWWERDHFTPRRTYLRRRTNWITLLLTFLSMPEGQIRWETSTALVQDLKVATQRTFHLRRREANRILQRLPLSKGDSFDRKGQRPHQCLHGLIRSSSRKAEDQGFKLPRKLERARMQIDFIFTYLIILKLIEPTFFYYYTIVIRHQLWTGYSKRALMSSFATKKI